MSRLITASAPLRWYTLCAAPSSLSRIIRDSVANSVAVGSVPDTSSRRRSSDAIQILIIDSVLLVSARLADPWMVPVRRSSSAHAVHVPLMFGAAAALGAAGTLGAAGALGVAEGTTGGAAEVPPPAVRVHTDPCADRWTPPDRRDT